VWKFSLDGAQEVSDLGAFWNFRLEMLNLDRIGYSPQVQESIYLGSWNIYSGQGGSYNPVTSLYGEELKKL
jgi:hypothetical protein